VRAPKPNRNSSVSALIISLAFSTTVLGTPYYGSRLSWVGTWIGDDFEWSAFFLGAVDETTRPDIVPLGSLVEFDAQTGPGLFKSYGYDTNVFYQVYPIGAGSNDCSMIVSGSSPDVTEDYPVTITTNFALQDPSGDLSHWGATVTFTATGGEGSGYYPYLPPGDEVPAFIHLQF